MNAATEFKEYMRNGSNHPEQFPQPGEGEFMTNIIRQSKKRCLSEYRGIPDPEDLDIIRCVLRPNEKYGEYLARTGLSIQQARGMGQAQIVAFCLAADQRNAEQGVVAAPKKTIPQKFTIEL